MTTLTITGWAVAAVLALLAAYHYLVASCASSEKRVWRERAERLGRRATARQELIDKLERRLVTCQAASKALRIAVASVAKAVEDVHATGATVMWNNCPADHEGD